MPVATSKESGHQSQEAFQMVSKNIQGMNGRSGVQNTDLIFLKGMMDSPVLISIVRMQDKLEENTMEPVGTGNIELAHAVRSLCMQNYQYESRELAQLLNRPHFQAMLKAHDTIANRHLSSKREKEALAVPEVASRYESPTPSGDEELPDTFKVINIRKKPGEPLGMTVSLEYDELVVARILGGGMIDRQGLLRVGDVVKEVNGIEVSTPEQLQEQLSHATDSITFKVVPTYNDSLQFPQSYVKAMFTYEPSKDSILPCMDIGLPFKKGDVLQILNREDPNWWQARQAIGNGPTGIIPSQELEEKRKAFVRPEFDYATRKTICGTRITKKKQKKFYMSKLNAEFDKAELMLYEEVARMPPFERKTLVFIGAQGVGRRSLKNKFLSNDSDRFGTIIPYTSRPQRDREVDGRNYHFATREEMESDINKNLYLEFGEHNEQLYGTKLDSIRSVIRSGKMCILDCNPQALKILNVPEFMPFVVFVAAPSIEYLKEQHNLHNSHNRESQQQRHNSTFERAVGGRSSRRTRTLESLATTIMEEDDLKKTSVESSKLQRAYEKYFDLVLINENPDETYKTLLDAVNSLSTEPQWVPVSWIYNQP